MFKGVTLKFETNEITTREDEGPVEVCVVAEGAQFGEDVNIQLQVQRNSFSDGTANSQLSCLSKSALLNTLICLPI